MPRAASRNEQDLSEFMTGCARAVTGAAADKALSFFFDYRGPSFLLGDETAQLSRLVDPLLRDAVDRLSAGCVFFSVDVIPHHPDRATVLMQVARTGRPASETVVNRLINATRPVMPDSRAGSSRDSAEGRARLACEALGGSLIVGDLPGEGHVVRADVLVPCRDPDDDLTIAIAQGLVAWLVGDPPVVFESLVRRLHRLGWKVCVFPSVSLARTHLRDVARTHPPDIVVGAERYKVVLDEFVDFSTMLPSRTACFATVLETSRTRLDPLGFLGRVQAFANPFSPRELHQLTVCALAKLGKRLRVPSDLTAALERRPRALLVEDNVINQLLSTEILQLFGFEVDVANNGQEAVHYCLRDLPAIVIMDLDMPVMDGLEATRQIRDLQRRGTLPYIPIVATTAKSSDDDRAQARSAGMDGFVPKPLDIAQLQQAIRLALQHTPETLPTAPDARGPR